MRGFSTLLVSVLLIVPMFLHAQATASTQSNLSVAIKNAIMADPRAASLSSAQISAIADALAQKAAAQGMTERDLYWRPMLAHTLDYIDASSIGDGCGKMPVPICRLNKMIGLEGSNAIVPVLLSGVLAFLLMLTAIYLELQHRNKAGE